MVFKFTDFGLILCLQSEVRIKPGTAGWEVQMSSLCYAVPTPVVLELIMSGSWSKRYLCAVPMPPFPHSLKWSRLNLEAVLILFTKTAFFEIRFWPQRTSDPFFILLCYRLKNVPVVSEKFVPTSRFKLINWIKCLSGKQHRLSCFCNRLQRNQKNEKLPTTCFVSS